MNLGQSVALCCYELARGPKSAPAARIERRLRPSTAGQQERLAELLASVLDASGYINPRARRSNLLKIRRLVARLQPSADDAQVLLGMLRQIGWKLKPTPDS